MRPFEDQATKLALTVVFRMPSLDGGVITRAGNWVWTWTSTIIFNSTPYLYTQLIYD